MIIIGELINASRETIKKAIENTFVDPLVQPLSVSNSYGMEFLKAIQQIMTHFPGIHTACGLSNISYGLPERKYLNQTFMTMAVCSGSPICAVGGKVFWGG